MSIYSLYYGKYDNLNKKTSKQSELNRLLNDKPSEHMTHIFDYILEKKPSVKNTQKIYAKVIEELNHKTSSDRSFLKAFEHT